MIPYLIVFFVSTFCMYIFEYAKLNRIQKNIFLWLAVMVLALFAGLRDYSIGTDVNMYVVPLFNKAKDIFSIIDFVDAFRAYKMEPLFMGLIFVLSKLFDSAHIALFVLSLITCGFFAKGVIKGNDITFKWLFFCLIFFTQSLNVVRQLVAASVLFSFFEDKKRITMKRAVLFSGLAMMFHWSGVVGLGAYFVRYCICSERKSFKLFKWCLILIVVAFPVILSHIDNYIIIAVELGVFPQKYLVFTESGNITSAVMYEAILKCVFLAASFILTLRKSKIIDSDGKFSVCLGLSDVFFSLQTSIFTNRFSIYFMLCELDNISNGKLLFNKNGEYIYKFCILLVAFILFYINYVHFGYGEIMPYRICF